MAKWASNKKEHLIFENWRRFLNEQEEEQVAPPEEQAGPQAGGVTSTQLLNMDLESFIGAINSNRKDVMQTLFSGLKDQQEADDQVTITPTTVGCWALRPTQSEVVFSKSLPFSLQRPELFMKYLTSDGPFAVGPPGNDAIVTLNGKYVLDGHHRWSSLFCVNPKAEIQTFDIRVGVDPKVMLKLMQASIAAYTGGQIPSNKGGGVNLFTIEPKELQAGIAKYITPQIAKGYSDLGLLGDSQQMSEAVEPGREEALVAQVLKKITGLVTRNVQYMKTNNAPIEGATERPAMPQTDAPAGSQVSAGGDTPKALDALEKGVIDFNKPFANAAE